MTVLSEFDGTRYKYPILGCEGLAGFAPTLTRGVTPSALLPELQSLTTYDIKCLLCNNYYRLTNRCRPRVNFNFGQFTSDTINNIFNTVLCCFTQISERNRTVINPKMKINR